MKQEHLISVIMPAFNCEKYIAKAIESILKQTYSHLELIIINDASTDSTSSIIRSFHDNRIKIIDNEKNSGVSISLNKGIDAANGKYIARMDADDYSYPNRLEKQIHFMENHPDYALCGTFAYELGGRKKFYHLTRDSYLKSLLLFYSCFIHPSVMFRANIIKRMKYKEEHNFCEDYDLWLRISKSYKIANLPHYLLAYRVYPGSVSFTKQEQMNRIRMELILKELADLSIYPTSEELRLHDTVVKVYEKKDLLDQDFLSDLSVWFSKLLTANKKFHKYNTSSFAAVLFFRWILSCHFTGFTKMCWNKNMVRHQTFSSIIKTIYLLLEKIYLSKFA